jgi:nucleoside-diphosphate-sugar epimerase
MIQTLVTGATGLLGRHTVEELAQAGVKIRALVRPSSDVRHLESLGVALVSGDAGDRALLERAVSGVDILFHLAGYLTADAPFSTTGNTSEKDWPIYQAINVDLTAALLRASVAAGVTRFVYVSSSSVYSLDAPVPTAEDAPVRPFSLYGRSKYLAEEAVRAAQAAGLSTTIIRPPIVYGPGDRYFTPMAMRLAKLPLLPLIKGGKSLMDLVYAGDVAALMWRAAQHPAAVGQVYNAGPGQPTTLYDLTQAYKALTGSAPRIVDVSLQLAERTAWLSRLLLKPLLPEASKMLTADGLDLMSRDLHLDMRKAQSALNFRPRFDLAAGLAETLAAHLD